MSKLRRPRRFEPADDLSLCVSHAKRAVELGREGGGEAQKAIFYLLQHLGPAAAPLTDVDSRNVRMRWVEALRFLDGCLAAPSLQGLGLALAELDRGIPSKALKVAAGGRRGGKSSTDELKAMRMIVEAADELKLRSDPGDFEDALLAANTYRQAVDDHRKKLKAGPAELAPRPWYLLIYAGEEPAGVLRRGLRMLAAVRHGQ